MPSISDESEHIGRTPDGDNIAIRRNVLTGLWWVRVGNTAVTQPTTREQARSDARALLAPTWGNNAQHSGGLAP